MAKCIKYKGQVYKRVDDESLIGLADLTDILRRYFSAAVKKNSSDKAFREVIPISRNHGGSLRINSASGNKYDFDGGFMVYYNEGVSEQEAKAAIGRICNKIFIDFKSKLPVALGKRGFRVGAVTGGHPRYLNLFTDIGYTPIRLEGSFTLSAK